MLRMSKLAAAVAVVAGGLAMQSVAASAMPALGLQATRADEVSGVERVQFYYGRPYGYYHRPYYGYYHHPYHGYYRRPYYGYRHRPFFGGYGYRRHFGYGGPYGYHHHHGFRRLYY